MSKHENLWGYLLTDGEDGHPVGYALLTSYWCNEDGGNVIIVDELYVNSANQHKGMGHHFLEWAENEFKDKAVSITLEVLTTNATAIALYSKLGYTPDGFEVMTKSFKNS
jgi:GNAT superfamily N-acetyltransferase